MLRWILWLAIPVIVVAYGMSYGPHGGSPIDPLLGLVLLFWFPITGITIVVKAVRWLLGSRRQTPSSSSATR